MKEKVVAILNRAYGKDLAWELTLCERAQLGHYATSVALRLAKHEGKSALECAHDIAQIVRQKAPAGMFEQVEVAPPGFINLRLSTPFLQTEFFAYLNDNRRGVPETLNGVRVMVEYTDPNPFKQFHIGHLMTNVIGESIARLHEALGASVIRVNYQGDVGVHVAKSVWGMMELQKERSGYPPDLAEKVKFLGRAYAYGDKAYRSDETAKFQIDSINKKIYERSDSEVNQQYDEGKQWSLEYFETLYARLGTKFIHYFFESEIGTDGLNIIEEHPDIFLKSEGAIIFPGEKYGLHSRVFVNSAGLPTYEAKELGLNKKKFELYQLDRSFIVTAKEINEYFQVLLKAMELVLPDVAAKTRHLGHGVLRLPTGKMSSRTGDVILAETLIETMREAVSRKMKENASGEYTDGNATEEAVALSAIRYSILKQTVGKDIIFDIEKSIAFHGDSGPYLQYTYARLRNIERKAKDTVDIERTNVALLTENSERELMFTMLQFGEVLQTALDTLSLHPLTGYLFKLANAANTFYESTPILSDENAARRQARLGFIGAVAATLKQGLEILGITALERM